MVIGRDMCAIATVVSLAIASCGVSRFRTEGHVENTTDSDEPVATQHLKTARALEGMGRHLEASIYFEASLDCGGNELEVLPLLVSSQVRAGRLEAAKQNIGRLAQIAPNRECVIQLRELLERLTPGPQEQSTGEMR